MIASCPHNFCFLCIRPCLTNVGICRRSRGVSTAEYDQVIELRRSATAQYIHSQIHLTLQGRSSTDIKLLLTLTPPVISAYGSVSPTMGDVQAAERKTKKSRSGPMPSSKITSCSYLLLSLYTEVCHQRLWMSKFPTRFPTEHNIKSSTPRQNAIVQDKVESFQVATPAIAQIGRLRGDRNCPRSSLDFNLILRERDLIYPKSNGLGLRQRRDSPLPRIQQADDNSKGTFKEP